MKLFEGAPPPYTVPNNVLESISQNTISKGLTVLQKKIINHIHKTVQLLGIDEIGTRMRRRNIRPS